MGKTSNAFIDDINTLAATAAKQAAAWTATSDAFTKVSNQFGAAGDAETKRVAQINPSGDDRHPDGGSWSKIINADPVIRTIGKQLDALGEQLTKLMSQRNKQRAELTATKKAGIAKLNEFSAYVTKKKAAWTLKSKKSIPAAETFIKVMRQAFDAIP
jgi:hypothetical protein